jgi:hypothetical protein
MSKRFIALYIMMPLADLTLSAHDRDFCTNDKINIFVEVI